ncbi:MAG: penicillin-binding protein activator LpoB, partial [Anaerolineales bacterium]|nr:penicillin-binding protein activator LpoB [Anaerolineales bacterium]
MTKRLATLLFTTIFLTACNLASTPTSQPVPVTEEFVQPATFTLEPATPMP